MQPFTSCGELKLMAPGTSYAICSEAPPMSMMPTVRRLLIGCWFCEPVITSTVVSSERRIKGVFTWLPSNSDVSVTNVAPTLIGVIEAAQHKVDTDPCVNTCGKNMRISKILHSI